MALKAHEIGAFGLSLLTLAGAGLFVASQTRSAVATEQAEAASEAERIQSWAFGHDAVPWPAELNGDGVTDYVGAHQAERPNGATVVAAIDGKTQAIIWQSAPLMMNLGHHHFALAGEHVVVIEKGKPPRLLDAATGRPGGAFAPDAVWGKLNPSRLCPDPAAPNRLLIEGYAGAKITLALALDLDDKTVQPTEPVSWCRFERAPGQAQAISPAPIATSIAVGDYGLSLGPTAQITRDGKPIKR